MMGKRKLTLWVGLSAVLLASRVQGNNLVANDVVARCDVGWNGHRGGEVVGYTHTHTHVGQDRDFCAGGRGKKGEKSHLHIPIMSSLAQTPGAVVPSFRPSAWILTKLRSAFATSANSPATGAR